MKHNTIRLYKHFLELSKNPIGADSQERDAVRKNAEKSLKNLREHFQKGKKYRDDEEVKALLNPVVEVEVKETKSDKKN